MYGHPDVVRLAENRRTVTKAAIKRASATARRDVTRLVDRSAADLERHYRRAAESLKQTILATAAPDGNVKVEALESILAGVRREISDLAAARDPALADAIREAAELGVDPFRAVTEIATDFAAVANEAARFVQEFVAEDGLRLSDRLWRIDSGAYRAIEDQLQLAIIRGDGASRAAQDFLRRGVAVPDDINQQLGLARAGAVSRVPGSVLLDEDGAYAKALRVFRTEINRAHGEAYQGAAFEHPDVIGTRFLLSPNHPRTDICDMHAQVNRYGLGPGVYPRGRNPWPAHPNTLSFVEAVFADEVTDEDRAGKEDRIAWLKKQPATTQQGVLGGERKQAAFERGLVRENEIATPWTVVKKRLERTGVDVSNLRPKPPGAPAPATPAPQGKAVSAGLDPQDHKTVSRRVLDLIDGLHRDGNLPVIPILRDSARGRYGAFWRDFRHNPIRITLSSTGDHKELTLAHEIGHYLDAAGIAADPRGRNTYGIFSSHDDPRFDGWRRAAAGSDSIRTLVKRLDDMPETVAYGQQRQYIQYLLQPHEIWARSYAQWVASRSGDRILKDQVAAIVRKDDESGMRMPRQWADGDFESIAQAIDRLFLDLGWSSDG